MRLTQWQLPALCLIAAAFAACGGDDDSGRAPEPTPPPRTAFPDEAEYFQQLEDGLTAVNAEALLLDAKREQAFDPSRTEAERLMASVEYGAEFEQYVARRRDTIAAVEPPESTAALHEALVEAANGMVSLAQEVNAGLATTPVSTSEAFADLLQQADGATVTSRYRDACLDVQARARLLSVQADLGCNE